MSRTNYDLFGCVLSELMTVDADLSAMLTATAVRKTACDPLTYLAIADRLEETSPQYTPVGGVFREVARVLNVSDGFQWGMSAEAIGGLALKALVRKGSDSINRTLANAPIRPPGRFTVLVGDLLTTLRYDRYQIGGIALSSTTVMRPYRVDVSPRLHCFDLAVRTVKGDMSNCEVYLHPLVYVYWLMMPYEGRP